MQYRKMGIPFTPAGATIRGEMAPVAASPCPAYSD